MLKKLKNINRYYLYAASALITISLLSFGMQKLKAHNTVKNERQYYQKQVKAVSYNIESIQKIISDPHALTDPEILPLYEKQLDSIIDRCHDVIKKKTEESSELTARSVASKEECRKLISLVAYQKNLYDQFEIILNMNAESLPASNDPNFVAKVSEVELIIRQTYNNVSLISSDTYDDQYKTKIEKDLANLQKNAYELQGSNNQFSRQLFITHLEEVQNNLLLYRGSYWNNVVAIEHLKADIDKAL